MRYEKLLAGVIIVGGLHILNGADARADGFGQIPEQGCPMSHCDPQMSDQVKLAPPMGGGGEMSRLLLKLVQQALLVEQATQRWPAVQVRG